MRCLRELRHVRSRMISCRDVTRVRLSQVPTVSDHGSSGTHMFQPPPSCTFIPGGMNSGSLGDRSFSASLPRHFREATLMHRGGARCVSADAAAIPATPSPDRTSPDRTAKKTYKWPSAKRPRICILGGGFGGLYTALRLESLQWPEGTKPQICLIDQSDRFVFKPLLYELLSKEVDQWEIAPRFSDLLAGTQVQFVRDTVKAVDDNPADEKSTLKSTSKSTLKSTLGSTPGSTGGVRSASKVVLGSGTEVEYDWLVLSLGSSVNKAMVEGAADLAQAFATLEDAMETDRKLSALERGYASNGGGSITVSVVGGGYSGVELAATVAQRLGNMGRVQIIDPSPTICSTAPEGNRVTATKVLSARKVSLLLNSRVLSLTPRPHSKPGALLSLSSPPLPPSTLEADLVLWTIGNKAEIPHRDSTDRAESTDSAKSTESTESENCSFPTSGRGQASTDSSLRVLGHPNVFALGDAAAVRDASGKLLGGTAQVAFQEADYVGWNLWAAINDRPLLPFRYQHLGEMMTLGGSDAAVTLGFVEGVTLDGPLAQAARKLAYLYRLPTTEHKAKVGLSWLLKSTSDAFNYVQSTWGSTTPTKQ